MCVFGTLCDIFITLCLADIVFFIFLYQRWIYRVDLKRVNEFGTSGEDHLTPQVEGVATALPPSGGASGAAGGDRDSAGVVAGEEDVSKTIQEKKND